MHCFGSLTFLRHVFYISVFVLVQRNWACFTWKGALEIKTSLLLKLLLSFHSYCDPRCINKPWKTIFALSPVAGLDWSPGLIREDVIIVFHVQSTVLAGAVPVVNCATGFVPNSQTKDPDDQCSWRSLSWSVSGCGEVWGQQTASAEWDPVSLINSHHCMHYKDRGHSVSCLLLLKVGKKITVVIPFLLVLGLLRPQ